MSTRAQALDHLYGDLSPETWAEILGPDLHYHFGTYQAEEDLEEAARATIRRFYPDIPDGASVLDVGCGWGGPARLLQNEKGCTVKGVTVSRTQAEYCRGLGLQVDELDLETATLAGRHDVAFMCESLDHIQDKARVLRQLRAVATRLIVRVSAISPVEQAQTRGRPSAMLLDTSARRDGESSSPASGAGSPCARSCSGRPTWTGSTAPASRRVIWKICDNSARRRS
jgi:hypothetical protein